MLVRFHHLSGCWREVNGFRYLMHQKILHTAFDPVSVGQGRKGKVAEVFSFQVLQPPQQCFVEVIMLSQAPGACDGIALMASQQRGITMVKYQ